MVRGPGISANAHRSVPVSGVDLLPTVLELAGAEAEFVSALDSIDGGSFAGVLRADEVEVQRPVQGLYFHVPYRNGIAFKRPHSAVRQGDFKLVLFQDDGEVRLYDLSADIGEQVNLADALPDKADAMRSDLIAYLSSVRAPRWQEGITWKKDPLATFNSVH
jgi:arylsulfatase A-like enzyme